LASAEDAEQGREEIAVKKTTILATLALVAVAGIGALAASEQTPAAQPAPASKPEKIQARVLNMRGGAGPNTGMLFINIDHWNTDEETLAYLNVFAQGGQTALVNLWQKERPVVGWVRFAQTVSYDLRVARSREIPAGRRVILVTDRPIAGFEVARNLRSEDYPIAWIELLFAKDDKEGEGKGTMIPAAQLSVKDNSLNVESYGTQPLRLVSAKVTTK
jgi:hypothetical protein